MTFEPGGMKCHKSVAQWDEVSYSVVHQGSAAVRATDRHADVEASRGGRAAMFLGDYQHTLDAKGRVSLPAKFRGAMTGKLVIAKGLDECLYVYPAEEYNAFVEALISQEDFDPRIRKVRRFFTTGAVETEFDSAGRVGLPANLREYAGLTKDVAVTGNGNRIEIWDAEAWSAYQTGEDEASIEDLARELADSGLL